MVETRSDHFCTATAGGAKSFFRSNRQIVGVLIVSIQTEYARFR
jgi:hypothetical protein